MIADPNGEGSFQIGSNPSAMAAYSTAVHIATQPIAAQNRERVSPSDRSGFASVIARLPDQIHAIGQQFPDNGAKVV